MARKRVAPFASDLLASIRLIGKAFETTDVSWWIQGHTLLATMRGEPAPSSDIDLGMLAEAFDWRILDEAVRVGLVVEKIHTAGPHLDGFRLVGEGQSINLSLVYPKAGRWAYRRNDRKAQKAKTSQEVLVTPFVLGQTNFLGMKVPCPAPAVLFLKEVYGPDWRKVSANPKGHAAQFTEPAARWVREAISIGIGVARRLVAPRVQPRAQ